jgi:hypothetical protein
MGHEMRDQPAFAALVHHFPIMHPLLEPGWETQLGVIGILSRGATRWQMNRQRTFAENFESH